MFLTNYSPVIPRVLHSYLPNMLITLNALLAICRFKNKFTLVKTYRFTFNKIRPAEACFDLTQRQESVNLPVLKKPKDFYKLLDFQYQF